MSTTDTTNLFNMEGQVVLVTGASSGLGDQFARVLSAAGAVVVVGARRVERLESLVAQLKEEGGTAMAVALDVTSPESVENCLSTTEQAFGPVTVFINNAGVADSRCCLKVEEEGWDYVMETNLKGA